MQNIYSIGVGLIGGSLAIDIKKSNPEVVIHGISRKEATLDSALSLNLIDKKVKLLEFKNDIDVYEDIIDIPEIMQTFINSK